MKNLKKTLCLVLALVFVLGLCTMGAGAAFSDEAQVEYTDAVTVMAGLGIIKGDDNDGDGKFEYRPGDPVTRAEAAKMITYMILGDKNAEKLLAKEAFDDVPATHWAAKYIYFCQSKGIINGYGNGKFGPSDKVTGTQMAKMLLCACGYGMMGEYTGAGWDVNVFVDAVSYGVFDDANTEDYAAAATRDEAALYVFNTLFIEQVAYDVDINKYLDKDLGDFATNTWKLAVLTGAKDDAKVYHPVQLSANQATGAPYTMIEDEYFNIETGLDLIAHDVTIYYNAKQKTDANGVDYYDAYLVIDESKVVNGSSYGYLGDIAKSLGYAKTDFNDIQYWLNYTEDDSTSFGAMIANAWGYADNNFSDSKIRIAYGAFDMGVYKSIYDSHQFVLDADGGILAFLLSKCTVAKVEAVNGESIVLSNKTGNSGTYEKLGGNGDYDYISVYEGIAKGDYVTLQQVGEGCFNILPTSTETVSVFQMANGAYNNNAISKADGFEAVTNADLFDTDDIEPGYTVKFFLDANGKYFAYDIVAKGDSQGYVFLVSIYDRVVDDGYGVTNPYYYAQCVDAAGNELNYLIPEAGYNTLNALAGTVNEQGVYSVVTRTSTDAEYGSNYTVADLTPVANYGKVANVTVAAGADKLNARVYFDDDAKFIYVDGKANKLTISVSDTIGKLKAADVYYVANEGSTVSTISNVWIMGKAPASMASSLILMQNYTNVYELDSDTGLFVKSPYKYGAKGGTILVGGVTYGTFTPYIDGASMMFTPIAVKSVNNSVTINPDADTAAGSGNSFNLGYIANGFYAYSVDSNGVYSLTTEDVISDTAWLSETYGPENLLYKGLLTVKSMAGNDYSFEAFDISEMKIVDISSATNEYTGRPLNISSVEQIADLLADGKQIQLSYAMAEDDDYGFGGATGKYVPRGVIYVTNVIG